MNNWQNSLFSSSNQGVPFIYQDKIVKCQHSLDNEPTIVHVYDVLHDPLASHVIEPSPVLRLYPVLHDWVAVAR